MPPDLADQVAAQGFATVRGILDRHAIDSLCAELAVPANGPSLRTRGGVFAIRNLLEIVPAVDALARSAAVRDPVERVLGSKAMPVRAILFDKTPAANWLVPWHQDLTIAVRRRESVHGYGPWSVKGGISHVQPPSFVLDAMLAVRIHLDPCDESNGALRLLPGTHLLGRLTPEQIVREAARGGAVTCELHAGDALLMKPLLLHASSASDHPAHRRVIHLEFAAYELPLPLEWVTNWYPSRPQHSSNELYSV